MSSSKRGPKPKPRMQPREPLQVEPPAELKLRGRVKQIYMQMAERLQAEGFASMADARTLANAASAAAMVERLEAEVAGLPSLIVPGGKAHPLLGELRQARQQLHNLLGALLLTPRSRTASRMTEEQARQAAARAARESPKLRFFEGGNHAANHG